MVSKLRLGVTTRKPRVTATRYTTGPQALLWKNGARLKSDPHHSPVRQDKATIHELMFTKTRWTPVWHTGAKGCARKTNKTLCCIPWSPSSVSWAKLFRDPSSLRTYRYYRQLSQLKHCGQCQPQPHISEEEVARTISLESGIRHSLTPHRECRWFGPRGPWQGRTRNVHPLGSLKVGHCGE